MADTKTIAPKEGALTRFWNWLTETQAWTSVFRHDRPNTDRNRVLVMLSNVFLHLHPVRLRKSGVKLRYPIQDGIPLLLPPELLQAANAAGSDQHDSAGSPANG